MSFRAKSAGALLIAGCAGFALVGCASDDSGEAAEPAAEPNGVQDLTVDEILDRVDGAVDSATSVHAVGELTREGQAFDMDVSMTSAGEASGTFSVGDAQFELIVIDGQTYFAGSEAFWTQQQTPPDIVAQVADKFVEVPAEDNSFADLADFNSFFGELLDPEGDVEKGAETSVDGIPALTMIDTEDDGELLIALEGEPYPLQVTSTEAEGALQLTDWNAEVTVSAPAAEEIVDLDSLEQTTP